ncbi:hypothetical protein AJ80_05973 [Polytolypa hystricis UAMH7299]|uniref:Major facilitator superfamily (MFS) profile domain-containing protein n=1 Tax=Polytolypa hystricis (strain UAMH7299) TaxID=1447883 RepID=A0A2B7Y034_POLH7|nr:hypothetical protein AJ80_05973 [Polytolypa hystricis UAMH7299]
MGKANIEMEGTTTRMITPESKFRTVISKGKDHRDPSESYPYGPRTLGQETNLSSLTGVSTDSAMASNEGPTPVEPNPVPGPDGEKTSSAVASVHESDANVHAESQTIKQEGVTLQTVLAIISLCFAYNGYLFTLLMPGIVLSQINADLGPDPSFPWINIVWNLAAAVLVTVGGRISDIFGRRWFLIVGAVLGAIGSLIGALGQSIGQMIAAGVIMGLGGGFQEIVFACVQEIVPNKRRLLALGSLEASNIIANFSPLISVAYITYSPLGWRACYWHMFAFECTAVVTLYFWYKPPTFRTLHKHDGKTKLQLLGELDYVGLFLFTAGCVLLLMSLNWGGRDYPWKSAAVITPIILSVVTFAALILWEVYYPLKHPILPPEMFRNSPQFCAITAVVFIGGMLYYSSNILWPRQASLLFAPADDPIIRGVYSNIFAFGTIAASSIVLTFVAHLGWERWQMVAYLAIQTTLIGCMSTVGVSDVAQAIAMIMLISMLVAPVNFLAFGMSSLALKDQNDIGVSQGVLSTMRLIGGAIATAIYTAVLQNRYQQLFTPKVTEAAESTDFGGDIPELLAAASNGTAAAFQSVERITEQTINAVQYAVKESHAESFQLVYLVAIAFGCVATLTGLTTRNIPKSKKTNEKAVHLENEILKLPPSKTVD